MLFPSCPMNCRLLVSFSYAEEMCRPCQNMSAWPSENVDGLATGCSMGCSMDHVLLGDSYSSSAPELISIDWLYSGISLIIVSILVESILAARSKISELFPASLRVHLYSSNFSLNVSTSVVEVDVAQRRPMNVPKRTKLYLDAEYQKDWRCSAFNDLTKSKAVVRRACAADRHICTRE